MHRMMYSCEYVDVRACIRSVVNVCVHACVHICAKDESGDGLQTTHNPCRSAYV